MNTTVWTQEADARLRDYLASHELVAGIGTEGSMCWRGCWRRSKQMVTTFDRGGSLLVTLTAPGTYAVHRPDQRPVDGVTVYHYERNNAWVCEVHGANHANTRLDCEHIRAVREISN